MKNLNELCQLLAENPLNHASLLEDNKGAIQTPNDVVVLSKALSPEQCNLAYLVLKDNILSVCNKTANFSFTRSILKELSPDKCRVFCEVFAKEIIKLKLNESKQNPEFLFQIFYELSPEQKQMTASGLQEELRNYFYSFKQLQNALQYTVGDDAIASLKGLQSLLDSIINDLNTLKELIHYLPNYNKETANEVLSLLKSHIYRFTQEPSELNFILRRYHRYIPIKEYEPLFNQIIRSPEAFFTSCKDVDRETSSEIYAILDEKIAEKIQTMNGFLQLFKLLNRKQCDEIALKYKDKIISMIQQKDMLNDLTSHLSRDVDDAFRKELEAPFRQITTASALGTALAAIPTDRFLASCLVLNADVHCKSPTDCYHCLLPMNNKQRELFCQIHLQAVKNAVKTNPRSLENGELLKLVTLLPTQAIVDILSFCKHQMADVLKSDALLKLIQNLDKSVRREFCLNILSHAQRGNGLATFKSKYNEILSNQSFRFFRSNFVKENDNLTIDAVADHAADEPESKTVESLYRML